MTVIEVSSPWMEQQLTRLVCGMWPKPVERKFRPGDEWFTVLVEEASKLGSMRKTTDLTFCVTLHYDFVGFRQIDGRWNVVYEIKERVDCTMNDGYEPTPLVGMTSEFKRDLRFMSKIPSERLFSFPVIEEVEVPVCVKEKKFMQKIWRLAKVPGY